MRVLFTGTSSFTGAWFVRALTAAGYEVVGTCTRGRGAYDGVRRTRLELCAEVAELAETCPFGSPAFLDLVVRRGPWDVLCHHGADVTNYRSAQFDFMGALAKNTMNLPEVLPALRDRGCRAVVLTGSVFEGGEGVGEPPLCGFSPYGLSKTLTDQVFRYFCHTEQITLGKFVVPNPFGPLEESRFVAYLMNAWLRNEIPEVRTPDYVRDNIHVDLLAECYRGFTEQVASASHTFLKSNPSGYIESQGSFALRVAREVKARTERACPVKLARQTEFAEPLIRANTEPAAVRVRAWSESRSWDELARYYLNPRSGYRW